MSFSEAPAGASKAWPLAARLLVRWLDLNERVDALLEGLPRDLPRAERARVQSLLFGAVRHLGRIEAHLAPLLARPPRTRLRAILLLAGYELIEGGPEGHVARVVHHAVEQTKVLASPSEARLVNAVVRKLAAALSAETEPGPQASARRLAEYFSHPGWLVERWWAQFGSEATRALLAWNQRPAPLYARWRRRDRGPSPEELAWLAPTPWAGFYEIRPGHWTEVEPRLAAGDLYVQDPATRLAVELLAPQPGEAVLDACAAPGGKTAHLLELAELDLWALDVDAQRLARVRDNLQRLQLRATLKVGDARRPAGWWDGRAFDAILLDAPCTASGIVRRHPDVRWLRRADDLHRLAGEQAQLLDALWPLLAAGGRLLYATCSIFRDEGERASDAFLQRLAPGAARIDPRSPGHVLPLADNAQQTARAGPAPDGFYYALIEKT